MADIEKIYELKLTQDIINKLEIIITSCYQIGASAIDFKDGNPPVALAEIAVDVKRAIAEQIKPLINNEDKIKS